MVEITGRKELKEWLEGRDRVDVVAIATRAVQRVLPILTTVPDKSGKRTAAAIFLPTFRALLISWTFIGQPVHEISSAAADAADAIWKSISDDATALETGTSPEALVTQRLWAGQPPKNIQTHWFRLKAYLLDEARADENWQVWTDWYEDRLQGNPSNKDLDRAIALMNPEKFWDAGPKIANAEIQRLIDEYRPTQQQIEDSTSPRVVARDGKLDVESDKVIDEFVYDDEFKTLPERQVILVDALLAAFIDDRNISPAVVSALKTYRKYIEIVFTRPMLGILDDAEGIAWAEYNTQKRHGFFKENGGLRKTFETFHANHLKIGNASKLNAVRAQIERESDVDIDDFEPAEIQNAVLSLENAIADALVADIVTEEYQAVSKRVTASIRLILETPPPAPGADLVSDKEESILEESEVPRWKRAILWARGFGGVSLSALGSLASIVAFSDTTAFKVLKTALKSMLKVLGVEDVDSSKSTGDD